MKSLGRTGVAFFGVASCGWLVLVACGGISQRGKTDDENGGSASGGSASKPSRGGSPSSNHAGDPAAAGTASAVAGTGMSMPTPNTAPAACFNDTDCPVTSCGGEVCNWLKAHPQPVGEKVFVCDPAGTGRKGQDGWCTSDENCKCLGLGAKCISPYCTFTLPADAPGR